MHKLTFPPRYYSHLLDLEEIESILQEITNPLECIKLLDVVALHSVLQSLPELQQQRRLLEIYSEYYVDKQLFTAVPHAGTLETIVGEQLERTIASLEM